MIVIGKATISQLDKGSRYKCKHWRIYVPTELGRKARRFTGSVTEAKQAADDFVAELQAEPTGRYTFSVYAHEWNETRKQSGNFADNTIAKDGHKVATLCRQFGNLDIRKITPNVIRNGMNDIRNGNNTKGKVLSGTYMQGLHICLHSIMKQAYKDGLIPSDPMDGMKLPKMDTKEKRALTEDELRVLLDKLDTLELDGHVMAVYFICLLGLRRGEACALRWSDIASDKVIIRHAVQESTGELGKPKSDSGKRTLPMAERLREKLEEWKPVHDKLFPDCEFVCCHNRGDMMLPQTLWIWWWKNRGSLECDLSLHELRHTNLTIVSRKLSVFGLKDWAGWSSIEPAKVYIHNNESELRQAASLFQV